MTTTNETGGPVAQDVLAAAHREEQRQAMMQRVAHAGDGMAAAIGELTDCIAEAEGVEAMLGITTAVYQALWQVGQLGEMLFDSAFCSVTAEERELARVHVQQEAGEWLQKMRQQLGL